MARKRKRGRIRSKAQRRKFAELLVKGKIDEDVYERWNRAAGDKKLPEHVKSRKKKRQAKPRRKSHRKSQK